MRTRIEGAGTVVFQAMEGGFFGIIDDDGNRYDPVDLDDGLKRDGLRIRFTLEPLQ